MGWMRLITITIIIIIIIKYWVHLYINRSCELGSFIVAGENSNRTAKYFDHFMHDTVKF
jgi:hypothetical protein